MDDRGAIIKIGDDDHELLLTTRATREIAKKYGGIENLGDQILRAESVESALDEIVWLIVLLANQSKLLHNLRFPGDKVELLTEEVVELLTAPADFIGYKDAIVSALQRGTRRYIESEDEPTKNAVGG